MKHDLTTSITRTLLVGASLSAALAVGCVSPDGDDGFDESRASDTSYDEASTEHALAGCSGSGCVGKDPIAMGCTSGTVDIVNSRSSSLAGVEVKYSHACNAYWVKAYSYVGTVQQVEASLYTQSPGSNYYALRTSYVQGWASDAYSNMWGGGLSGIYGCVRLMHQGNYYYERVCS